MTVAGAERSPGTGAARQHDLAERILSAGIAVAVAGVAIQTLIDLVNLLALDHDVDLLNADSDIGVFAWASIAATFGAALGAVLLSFVLPERRPLLLFVAAAAAFLSLDDQVQLHERAGGLADRSEGLAAWEPARLLWPVVFFPLLFGLFLALLSLSRSLFPRAGRCVLVGLGLLGAAVVLELLSAGILRAGFERGGAVYELEVILEEGAELAGWILVAAALLAAFALAVPERPATISREGG